MTPIMIILLIIFTVGLVLGTVALFYMPENVIEEARAAFAIQADESFEDVFKTSFVMEFCWITAVWILGSISLTAPFTATVMALRGFLIGFSVAFVLTGKSSGQEIMLKAILPQCVIGLPMLSIFTMLCMRFVIERTSGENVNFRYFALGAVFALVTLLTACAEAFVTVVL